MHQPIRKSILFLLLLSALLAACGTPAIRQVPAEVATGEAAQRQDRLTSNLAPASGDGPQQAGDGEPDVEYTLVTGGAYGGLVFVGRGGEIDGVVNPTLTADVGDVVKIVFINEDGILHDFTIDEFGVQAEQTAERGSRQELVFTVDEEGEFVYYCSVPGHRQAGMWGTLRVGEPAVQVAQGESIIRDPADVPPPVGDREPTTVQVELTAREVVGQLADGALYRYFTFDGTVPGPMIRVRVGDTVEVRLRNADDSDFSHSIDLHAVNGPGGGAVYTRTDPGGETVFTFQALAPGLYVYHCATPSVAHHIANGMYGLILVEPEGGLPPVDREFYVMQGEVYTAQPYGSRGLLDFDAQALLDERPQYFVFNGAAGGLTSETHALRANVGETVRIFFGVGGPNFTSSFHVIGEIFDRVYDQASLTTGPLTDVQTTVVPPGGAAMVEFTLDVPGRYILVDHALSRLERGLAAYLIAEGEDDPAVFHEGLVAEAAAPAPAEDGAAAGASTAATAVEVSISAGRFEPHSVAVATGATVTWVNNDTVAHTIVSHDGWFESPPLAPGESFSWQVEEPGDYTYRCAEHGAEGVIVALPGGAVAGQLFDGRPVDQYYTDTCGGCHGPHREGGTGPALIPARLTGDDQFYFNTIQNGRPGTVMPAWGTFGLSEEETWMLVGYIRSEVEAEDVQWELADVAGSRQILVPEDQLPPEPTHDGNLDNLMLVTEREARSIAVIDGDTHRLLGHVAASYRAHGYAFDPTSDRWAYNVGRDGWLFKIDLYSLQAVASVRVGLDSRGLAISDDGRYLIVGNYIPATAVILDAATLEPLRVIHTEGTDPDGNFVQSRVCITSDMSPELVGPYFIIALKEAGQLWRIDYSQPDFPIDRLENVGHILHDGFLSPDNRYFYIASQQDNWMAVVDVATWELVDRIETGAVPHPGSGATWEVDGVIYGATVHAGEGLVTIWDLADNAIVAQIPTSGPGLFIRAHDHNPYVWADTVFAEQPNEIYVIDKRTFEVVTVIDDGTQTVHPELTADGNYVYISDWQENVVRVYDAYTFEPVTTIDGITTPTGIFNTERRLETLGH